VTAVSHASSSFKRKIKEIKKENQYKIRKIEEKKDKIVSVQASHNRELRGCLDVGCSDPQL